MQALTDLSAHPKQEAAGRGVKNAPQLFKTVSTSYVTVPREPSALKTITCMQTQTSLGDTAEGGQVTC